MFHEVWALEKFQTAKVTFKVIQGHSQWWQSIGYIRFPISVPFPSQLCLYLAPLTRYRHMSPNLITVILSTIYFLSLNYSLSSWSRTHLIRLSLGLLNHVILLPSYALSTGAESINASNTSSSYLPTKLSQLPNLNRFIASVQRPRSTRSLSVVTVTRPPTLPSLK